MSQIAVITCVMGVLCLAMGEYPLYQGIPSINGEELDRSLFPDFEEVDRSLFSDSEEVDRSLFSDYEEPIIGNIQPNLDEVDFPSVPCKLNVLPMSQKITVLIKRGIPIIEILAGNFIRSIKARADLVSAYDISAFNYISLSNLFGNLVLNSFRSICAPDAETSALFVTYAVYNNFKKAGPFSLLHIFAYSAAEVLFFRGYLNNNNVYNTLRAYFSFAERRIKAVPIPTPEAKVTACWLAFLDLLTFAGHFNAFSTVMIAGVFSNRWYVL